MNHIYVVFMGGSGARVANAATWLASAGLFNECADIHMLIADAHESHKDRVDVAGIIHNYNSIHNTLNKDSNNDFCKPNIHLYNWNIISSDNDYWRSLGGQGMIGLAQMGMNGEPYQDEGLARDLLDALFSEYEQEEMKKREGFHAHPSVGATLTTASILYNREKHRTMTQEEAAMVTDEYQRFQQSLKADIERDKVSIFLIGSLFGGTGAACMSSLSRDIRSLAKENLTGDGEFSLHGVFLGSYFSFREKEGEQKDAINPSNFPNATITALRYYDTQHLLKRDTNTDATFDSVYFLGFPEVNREVKYDESDRQTHPPHLVELEAAMAIRHGMKETARLPSNVLIKGIRQINDSSSAKKYYADWDCLSEGKNTLLPLIGQHIVFSAIFTSYWFPILIDKNGTLNRDPEGNLMHDYLTVLASDGMKNDAEMQLNRLNDFLLKFLEWWMAFVRAEGYALQLELVNNVLLESWLTSSVKAGDVSSADIGKLSNFIKDIVYGYRPEDFKRMCNMANRDRRLLDSPDSPNSAYYTGLLVEIIHSSMSQNRRY